MKLSIRLTSIVNEIVPTDIVCDIGCDHGHLLVGAIKKGVKNVIAIDNKNEPLKVAKRNLKPFEKNANISYLLSDGLTNLPLCTVIVIAGMGGDLISKILRDGENNIETSHKLILEANTQIDTLRYFLWQNKYHIEKELMVEDKKKYYEIIIAKRSDRVMDYTENDIIFGPILRIEKSLIWRKMWEERLKMYEKIYQNPDLNHDVKHQIGFRIKIIKDELGDVK